MPSSRYYRFKTANKKEKVKKFKIIFFWLLILAAFSAAIWTVFLSPLFNIRNIETSDDAYLNRNDIERTILNIAPFGLGKNLLTLPAGRLKSELNAAFPAITDIKIIKNLFHTVIINFKERIPAGIWCRAKDNQNQDGDCYYFDKEGIIFAKAPQTEGSLILKIEDNSNNDFSLGSKVLDDSKINFIIDFTDRIGSGNKFKIIEFKIKPLPSVDLEAVTDQNWSIYLDEKQELAATVSNLFTILENPAQNAKNLEYIDLRIPSRVFYKLK